MIRGVHRLHDLPLYRVLRLLVSDLQPSHRAAISSRTGVAH
jgi:hypothetical protein